MITDEVKQGKILELANLIFQYNSGERENIKAEEFGKWELISSMLKKAEISAEIYEDFLDHPTRYKIENDQIILNENWVTEAEEAEKERIGKLHITKRDFFYAFCKPANITMEALEAKVAEVGMSADWTYCNHVYYGVIQPFLKLLPLGKTEAEIITIFDELCNKGE